MYICDLCNRSFKRKENMTNHKLKNVCQGKDYQCTYCKSSFTSKGSLNRHLRHMCTQPENKESNTNDKNCDSENNELLILIKDMQSQINKLTNGNTLHGNMTANNNNNNTISNVNNVNNNVNNNNNTMNITINVVPFGKEDISKIDKTDLLKVFKSGFNSALQLTETTHFNPKYPEFHNVYISNMKNKYAMTYDGSDWSLVMKDELIDKMYDKKRDYIEENMDDFLDSLSNSQIKALRRWMDSKDDHPYVQKIKNDMKLMLYNKRKLAMNVKYQQIDLVEDIDDQTPSIDDSLIRVIKEPKSEKGYKIDNNKSINNIRIVRENAQRSGTKRKIAKVKINK